MEHIEMVCSLESKLYLITICSVRILNNLEVIAKKRDFRKNRKMRNPGLCPEAAKRRFARGKLRRLNLLACRHTASRGRIRYRD